MITDIFPSLALCRGIPAGMFDDTGFVWVETPEGKTFVMERADAAESEVTILCPAPTQTECLMQLEETGNAPCIPDRAARALMDVLHQDGKQPCLPPDKIEKIHAVRQMIRKYISAGQEFTLAEFCDLAKKLGIPQNVLAESGNVNPRNVSYCKAKKYLIPSVRDQFRACYGVELVEEE